ncbi:hypothetical protein NP233_g12527 [Leucocoprinus birnbaumii]|uniref:Zinc finger PHD-type domain-containing protein n=1 Tax=Leucocoprinus birnbaumii TaxID=56174 RepID=A0AAD5VEV8_9AGAR|nr:hypothetical protein NP233_g12527 [Leucocoprinus birnbaumii]
MGMFVQLARESASRRTAIATADAICARSIFMVESGKAELKPVSPYMLILPRSLAESLRSQGPHSANLLIGGYDAAAHKPKLCWIDCLETVSKVLFAAWGSAVFSSSLDRCHDLKALLEGIALLCCIQEVLKGLNESPERYTVKIADKMARERVKSSNRSSCLPGKYEPPDANIHSWTPVLISFLDGASAQHFQEHFLALFKSIEAELGDVDTETLDCYFAGVMDFSEAEREGFIKAYQRFYQTRNDPRTDNQLRADAQKLLRGFLDYFQTLHSAVLVGRPIRHGQPEPWKMVKERIGQTKPSQTIEMSPKKKSDARPPDTQRELTRPVTHRATQNTRPKAAGATLIKTFGNPGYPYKQSSCWLDSTLELLFHALQRSMGDLSALSLHIDPLSIIGEIIKSFREREVMSLVDDSLARRLSEQRDLIRECLFLDKKISGTETTGTFFHWFIKLLEDESSTSKFLQDTTLVGYFLPLVFDLHICTGDPLTTNGQHIQVSRTFSKKFVHRNMLSRKDRAYWRPGCHGKRGTALGVVVSLPVILIVELEAGVELKWTIPAKLTPARELGKVGVQYDLMGVGFITGTCDGSDDNHFSARYLHSSGGIFTYDDAFQGGRATFEDGATVASHMTGTTKKPADYPLGSRPHYLVYHLRGGLNAQQRYYSWAVAQIEGEYKLRVTRAAITDAPSISYSGTDLAQMNPDDCTWIQDPRKAPTDEYVHPSLARPFTPGEFPIVKSMVDSDHSSSEDSGTDDDGIGDFDNDIKMDKIISPDIITCANQLLQSASDRSTSTPLSEFDFFCRCQLRGDGNIIYCPEQGEAIKCDSCGRWSHISCQRLRRAQGPRKSTVVNFTCDLCDLRWLTGLDKNHIAAGEKLERSMKCKGKLSDRLRAGITVPVQAEVFWYPARLLPYDSKKKAWTVKWWRGCCFEQDSGRKPGEITIESEEQIVDSLWGDVHGRRKIRLGKFKLSFESTDPDEIFYDLSLSPYMEEIDDALRPHLATLKKLLLGPGTFTMDEVPVIGWLKSQRKDWSTAVVPFIGNLTVEEQVHVANWLHQHVSNEKPRWTQLMLNAHALTLLIAHRLKQNPPPHSHLDAHDAVAVIQFAWKILVNNANYDSDPLFHILSGVDVDKESLWQLEKLMFTRRCREAGPAGNMQWGLDAGDHQDGWDPYKLTSFFAEVTRDDPESERERGPAYISIKPAEIDVRSLSAPVSPNLPTLEELTTQQKSDNRNSKKRKRVDTEEEEAGVRGKKQNQNQISKKKEPAGERVQERRKRGRPPKNKKT